MSSIVLNTCVTQADSERCDLNLISVDLMRFQTRLMFCLVAPVVLLIVALAFALNATFDLQSDIDRYQRTEQTIVVEASLMTIHATAASVALRDLLVDPSSMKAPLDRIAAARAGFDAGLQASERASEGMLLAARVTSLHEARAALVKAQDQVIEMRQSDPAMAIVTLNAQEAGAYQKLRSELSDLLKDASASAAAADKATQLRTSRALILVLVVAVGAVVVAAVAGLLMRRILDRELGGEPAYARATLVDIANGDLTVAFDHTPPSSSLLGTVGLMRVSLAALVQEVRGVSISVSTASAEISSGSQDLSSRTEKAAASLQASVQSMSAVAQAAKVSARSAVEARRLSTSAEAAATRGEAAMGQASASMGKIRAASERISEITGLIDALTAQTNILALNAAVEASRAGDHGRGFAVVAAEVRELAQRAARASSDIRELVNSSTADIEVGSGHVASAGDRMHDVLSEIRRIIQVSDDIVRSAEIQDKGVQGVVRTLEALDSATQQNAALSEQSAAASESLNQQAERLIALILRFKTGVSEYDRTIQPSQATT